MYTNTQNEQHIYYTGWFYMEWKLNIYNVGIPILSSGFQRYNNNTTYILIPYSELHTQFKCNIFYCYRTQVFQCVCVILFAHRIHNIWGHCHSIEFNNMATVEFCFHSDNKHAKICIVYILLYICMFVIRVVRYVYTFIEHTMTKSTACEHCIMFSFTISDQVN